MSQIIKSQSLQDKETFNEQIQKYKQTAYYDMGITPQYRDKLLTLSTCEYSNDNGQLTIVARKVEQYLKD